MKKIALATAITLAFLFRLPAQQAVEYLNVNMVNAGMGIGGNLFTVFDSLSPGAQFHLHEVPKGTNKGAIFTASLWLSGLDTGGNVYCAAQEYKAYGSDFYDGPIANVYDAAYDSYYKRVFKITQAQINEYRALTFPVNTSAVDSSVLLWPGKGNTVVASTFGVNIVSDLAPFIDVDNDGIYNPLNGDYPAICGDEAVFFVFNDVRGPHTETGSANRFGVEVHGMAYEFTDTTSTEFIYPKRAVNNTVFVQYDIENKSTNTYNNFYLALWEDPDIGCFSNDRVGCDTPRNLMFAYNGTTPDPDCQNEIGYAPYQAAQGVKMLNQNMSDFVYFTNGEVPGQSDPSPPDCPVFRNYMTGYWADGTPFTFGGNGYGGTKAVKFVFPGSLDDTSQWSEISVAAELAPGDRRMTGSIGPMNFNAGEVKHFDLAFSTAYDSTATLISIVDTLKRDEDIVQAFYNNNVVPCRNQLIALGINQPGNESLNVLVYPNPSNGQFIVEAGVDMESVILMDITGRIIMQHNINARKTLIDAVMLAKGLYLLKVKCGNSSIIKKVAVN